MPVMVAGVLAMSAAQLFDLATFVNMVHRLGPAAELNPLVGAMYAVYGYPMVAIVKVVLLALVTAVATILFAKSTRPRLAGAVVALGILIGLVGGLSNAIAIGAI
jgi:hypothetical protein